MTLSRYLRILNEIILLLFIAFSAVFLSHYLRGSQQHWFVAAALAFALLPYGFYGLQIKEILLILFLLICLSSGRAVSTERILFITSGVMLSASIKWLWYQGLYWCSKDRQAKAVLHQLKRLNDIFFTCLLNPEYPLHLYAYERLLHAQKMKCLQSLSMVSGHIPTLVEVKLNALFDLLLDCSQIRWRVTDHTTFAICRTELMAIHKELTDIFILSTSRSRPEETIHNVFLEQQIQKLEETYHSVLQVVAPDPLVFRLFIFSLQNVRQQLWEVHGLLNLPEQEGYNA